MNNTDIRFRFLLEKYKQENISQEELKEFWYYLSEMPDEELLPERSWLLSNDNILSENEDLYQEIWQRINNRIRQKQLGKERNLRLIYFAAAAAIIGLIITGYIIFSKSSLKTETDSVSPAVSISSNESPVKVITLPDGTTVTLKKGSILTYNPSFNRQMREVKLTGEAYFDVKHDSQRPFRVNSGDYSIDVLGTAFNVKQGTAAGQIEVTVARGKVSVADKRTKEKLGILLPGSQILVKSSDKISGGKEIIQNIILAPDKVNDWTKQALSIQNNRWAEAAKLIETKFGVSIQFKNTKVQECRFTGDFTDKSLDECLDIFTLLTKSKWYKEGTSIIWIDGNGCD